ncbi:MAG TPA: helix-turn-helix domain-containing protein [Chloroflexota bacterium]|nr:helix-turn-helix domain-containing protein [Chloroflexota bacterium]
MRPTSGPLRTPSVASEALGPPRGFADWLNATMHSRGLSQAQLARVVGVADTQVSRWRRGQVVPTVRYLQRIADTLDVPRANLDRLAGYPVDLAEGAGEDQAGDTDPQRQAELDAYSAAFRMLLEQRVPRPLWRAFADACAALAGSMSTAYDEALARSGPAAPPERPAGFRTARGDERAGT